MISWCRARRDRAPISVLHFRTILVQALGNITRQHCRQLGSVRGEVSCVYLVLQSPARSVAWISRLILADFREFTPIIPQNYANIYRKIGQKHGIVNLLFWVNHIVLNHSFWKCFYRVFTWNGEYFQCQHSWNENHNLGHDFEISENLYVYLYLKIS